MNNNIETPENLDYCLDDGIGYVSLIQHVGDDCSVVNSARVSFNKQSYALSTRSMKDLIADFECCIENKNGFYSREEVEGYKHKLEEALAEKEQAVRDRKLIKFLLEHRHGTPLEHNSLTFLVKCPLFVARQWMRHRMGSFNEVSYRYVEATDEFYIPHQFRGQSPSNRQASVQGEFSQEEQNKNCKNFEAAVQASYKAYKQLLESGVAREQARGVLPLTTYTQYYWTCNLRSFLHFIELRNHKDAQWEIACYAKAMLNMVKKIFPNTIEIWKELNKCH